jgi:hypothetical protein
MKGSRTRLRKVNIVMTGMQTYSRRLNATWVDARRNIAAACRLRRPDCVAGHVRLELRNVAANDPFESPTDLQESSRILATETIRV